MDLEARFYRPEELPPELALKDLPRRAEPGEVLLCDPAYFRIGEAQNPHMATAEGAPRRVDRRAAWEQWETVGAAYARLGFPVHVLPSAPGLDDMVFAANPALPFLDAEGRRAVVPSRMRAQVRRGEVAHHARWYAARGYRVVELPGASAAGLAGGAPSPQPSPRGGEGEGTDQPSPRGGEGEGTEGSLEGMGDCLLVPGRRAILAGIGPRTSEAALRALAPLVSMPVVGLELLHPRFYHLDTCLALLNERTALFVREGLAPSGVALVERLFADPIAVPLAEADSPGFAANAHSPDGRHVLIQRGNRRTVSSLGARGLEPVELDTSEFAKSGGSVFCLKMMVY